MTSKASLGIRAVHTYEPWDGLPRNDDLRPPDKGLPGATGITAYLENRGTIENAQGIAAHESPRTTKLYDRTSDEITLDEVERIAI